MSDKAASTCRELTWSTLVQLRLRPWGWRCHLPWMANSWWMKPTFRWRPHTPSIIFKVVTVVTQFCCKDAYDISYILLSTLWWFDYAETLIRLANQRLDENLARTNPQGTEVVSTCSLVPLRAIFTTRFFTRNVWWFSEDWHVAHSEVQTDCGWSWRRHPVRWLLQPFRFKHIPSPSVTFHHFPRPWNVWVEIGDVAKAFSRCAVAAQEQEAQIHSWQTPRKRKEPSMPQSQVQWGYGFWCVHSCTREVLSSDNARRSTVSSNPLIISNPPSHYFHLSRRRSVKLALEGHAWLEWPSECFSRCGKNQK